jgi:hypothetical protein
MKASLLLFGPEPFGVQTSVVASVGGPAPQPATGAVVFIKVSTRSAMSFGAISRSGR